MFEELVPTITGILTLSVGGISVGSIIIAFIIFIKKMKSSSITKEDVEKAFTKAVLPANVRIDISQKIMPIVNQTLSNIKTEMKGFLQENMDEVLKIKTMMILVLEILSKFSHTQQLTDEQKALLEDIVKCSDQIKEVQI